MSDLDQLTSQALEAAYSGNWKQAIELNQQIINQNPQSLDALNRMAKAYIELNQPQKAQTIYRKVLKLDPYNSIAQKNLQKLKNYSSNTSKTVLHSGKLDPEVTFIEEPGKSKTISLVNIGEPSALAQVDAGDPVQLKPKKRFICVSALNNLHLGKIPEDLSLRLITLIKGGNKYQAWIKSIDSRHITIFIQETYRTSQFNSIFSFPDSNHTTYLAFTNPASAYPDKPDTTSTENQT